MASASDIDARLRTCCGVGAAYLRSCAVARLARYPAIPRQQSTNASTSVRASRHHGLPTFSGSARNAAPVRASPIATPADACRVVARASARRACSRRAAKRSSASSSTSLPTSGGMMAGRGSAPDRSGRHGRGLNASRTLLSARSDRLPTTLVGVCLDPAAAYPHRFDVTVAYLSPCR